MILIARNWWSLILRGVAALVFGILALLWPGMTLGVLALWFGAYALVDGVVNLVGAFKAARAHERWGAFVIEGIVGIVAGVVTFAWPALTVLALVYIIAVWSLVTGVFEIAAAIRLRRHISGEWLLMLAGIASIFFGMVVMAVPLAGALALAVWVGVYALIFGGTLIGLGVRLRNWRKITTPFSTAASAH